MVDTIKVIKFKVQEKTEDPMIKFIGEDDEIDKVMIQWVDGEAVREYKTLEALFQYIQEVSYGENYDKLKFRKQLAHRILQWKNLIVEDPMNNLELFCKLTECGSMFEDWAIHVNSSYIGSKDLWSKTR